MIPIPSMNFTGCKTLAAFCALLIPCEAQVKDKPVRFRKGLLFESKIENPKVFSAVEGGKKTLLVPAYEWEYGVRVFTKETWSKTGGEWNTYKANAVLIADAIVDTLKPEWRKDQRGVIDYAILQSEDPFLGSVILSKKLHGKFKNEFGENIHVIIPERGTIYLFPAEGGKLDGYGPSIIKKFKESAQPVSIEVFLLTSTGYEITGELEE
ncbi:MAG: hypothetical protein ACKVJU_10880 [Verrucomicrobiales bacterium]